MRQVIAQRIHEELLASRTEERVTLLVDLLVSDHYMPV